MDCTGLIKIYKQQKNIVWRYIEGTEWDYYYAEEDIYIFRKTGSDVLHISEGKNPYKAFNKLSELTGNGG
ncbi:hypothetical protein [Streptococcus uberis]|uniref:hypothetical protein n=1 Tax=Streptococcus uberis TaxID=1349 RepID=UPI0020BEB037|nr:hypothetical protein [Streptococcus uberis]